MIQVSLARLKQGHRTIANTCPPRSPFMPSLAVAFPILPGKIEQYTHFSQEALSGRHGFNGSNRSW